MTSTRVAELGEESDGVATHRHEQDEERREAEKDALFHASRHNRRTGGRWLAADFVNGNSPQLRPAE